MCFHRSLSVKHESQLAISISRKYCKSVNINVIMSYQCHNWRTLCGNARHEKLCPRAGCGQRGTDCWWTVRKCPHRQENIVPLPTENMVCVQLPPSSNPSKCCHVLKWSQLGVIVISLLNDSTVMTDFFNNNFNMNISVWHYNYNYELHDFVSVW